MATVFNPSGPYASPNSASNASYGSTSSPWSGLTQPSTGASSINGYTFPDFTTMNTNAQTAANNMFNTQNSQAGNFLTNYANAINSQETQPAMWQRLANETGFNTYNREAVNAENALEAIPQQTTASTRGFDVNANQLGNIQAMQQWKLAPIAQRAANQAQNAANIMGTQMQLAQAQQNKELLPYQSEQSMLTDYFARQSSNFTTQNEQQYNALIAQMQSGQQLTQDQQDNLNRLATAKMAYDQAIAVANINATSSQNVAKINAGASLAPGYTYYNPYTSALYNPTNPYINKVS